jgi:hypothetical protein
MPGQVVRTIELTLSPADLGSVNVRLSLKANVLTIEAEATKASTAKMLNDDRDALERGLRDAGYDVSALKIAGIATANSTAASGSSYSGGAQFQASGQAGSAFAQGQDGDPSRRDGAASGQSQQRSGSHGSQSNSAADVVNSRQSNAIYI